METTAYREPFDAIGITPPRGRQGHSVPTPRPLTGGIQDQHTKQKPNPGANIVHQPQVAKATKKAGPSPAQFYSRREHAFGGSLSRLNRLASRTELSYLESFSEVEEAEPVIEVENGDSEVFDCDMNSDRPTSRQSRASGDLGASRNSERRATLEQFSGDSLLHFSYSTHAGTSLGLNADLGGSFVQAFAQGLDSSLTVPFLGQSSLSPDVNASTLFPTTARNPNKAIVTIDALSSRILTANEMTCELFGYQRNELVNIKVQSLFTEPYRAEHRALIEQNIDSSGKTVLISGKVMDAVTSYGVEFPVSVWMKRVGVALSPDVPGPLVSRVIVIVEPVERSSAILTINQSGTILSFDPWFACLFGYTESFAMAGRNISEFLPSLTLPSKPGEFNNVTKKQAITGRSIDGTVFPVTIKFTDVSQNLSIGDLYSPTNTASGNPLDEIIERMCAPSPIVKQPPRDHSAPSTVSDEDTFTDAAMQDKPTASHQEGTVPEPDSSDQFVINAKVVVYAALSGMISFLPDGSIHGCNNQFTSMLFGYSQEELFKKDITFLIPEFYSSINYIDESSIPLPPLDEDQEDLFHSVIERSFSPERAYDLIQQAGVSCSEASLSPRHSKGGGRHRSPARRALNIHSPQPTPHKQSDSSQDYSLMGTGELVLPDCSESSQPTEATTMGKALDGISAASSDEDLTSTSSDVIINLHHGTDVFSSSPDPKSQVQSLMGASVVIQTATTQSLPPVPNKLVPSQSTERIFEILRQHDLEKSEKQATLSGSDPLEPLSSTPAGKSAKVSSNTMFTVGQRRESYESVLSISSLPEGTFLGEARHKDGSLLAIIFQLKCIALANDEKVFCVWISRDLDQDRARTADLSMSMSRPPPDPYRTNQLISPDVITHPGGETDPSAPSPLTLGLHPSQHSEESVAMDGEYMLSYNTLKDIGKGAFGFVRLAQRKEDDLMVVVKFLRKSSVLKDCWMIDEEMGRVPLEISLLARLSHPNIVQLLEAYENEFFFQMVMEKHGNGLDLFEFIEMGPQLEEPLISHMFRQIVAGLSYLHDKSILHRDIKDENIIINQEFHLKLIDFGSAAYMAPGKVFNTFCGTLEYCSPEVLLGNSYTGPELEMWALGVTLYTLVFGENPFFDIEETISGHLQPPFLTSPALMKVLFWLLHPDPGSRATLKDLQKDKWTNQEVDPVSYSFDAILGMKASKNAVSEEGLVLVGKSNSESDALYLHSAFKQQLQMTGHYNR